MFWFCVRLPRIRWVASPPVSHSLLELTQSFLRFYALLNVPRICSAVHFFCPISRKNPQKNSFSGLFSRSKWTAVQGAFLSRISHFIHLDCSVHEVWQIRGRHFSTARGNFSRQNAPGCPHEVREFPDETARVHRRGHGGAERGRVRLCCARSACRLGKLETRR